MKIPMVDLPLGATEDRVCGTIDIEKALTEGESCAGTRARPPPQLCADCGQRAVRAGAHAQMRPQRTHDTGVKAFEPGLLAKANRGILYVDEVNLLDDHLVGY